MTELSFLLEILLNHKLGKVTKDALKARIDEIQKSPEALFLPPQQPNFRIREMGPGTIQPLPKSPMIQEDPNTQMASMLIRSIEMPPQPVPEAQIGQTPAAQAALQHRAAMIRQGISGNPGTGNTSPPKSHGIPR